MSIATSVWVRMAKRLPRFPPWLMRLSETGFACRSSHWRRARAVCFCTAIASKKQCWALPEHSRRCAGERTGDQRDRLRLLRHGRVVRVRARPFRAQRCAGEPGTDSRRKGRPRGHSGGARVLVPLSGSRARRAHRDIADAASGELPLKSPRCFATQNAFFRTDLSPSILAHVSVIEVAFGVTGSPLPSPPVSYPGECAPGSYSNSTTQSLSGGE